MTTIQSILKVVQDGITAKTAVGLAASALKLVDRAQRVAMASGMSPNEWVASVKTEGVRLDSWQAATDAAEDAALRGG